MLDSPKAQAVYRAMQSSSGFHSSAGDKAVATIDKTSSLQSQIEQMSQLPEEGIPDGGSLPTIVPDEIKNAVSKLATYKAMLGGTEEVAQTLNGAIEQRMGNITGNMAMMSAASGVASKMGDVAGGCGPLGAAFSVLTSEGRTAALQAALNALDGPLSDLAALIKQGTALNSSMLPPAMKEALDAAMALVDAGMQNVNAATAPIRELVDEAQAMWNKLDAVFTEAVQSSILASMWNNPCMQGVIEAVSPPEVTDILSS